MLRHKKNWFTLVEIVIVCSVFAILLTGIIWAINRAYLFMNNIKHQVRATNLSREWVEMMFNIRDTNWRKCSWKKDEFWLYQGTGWNVADCTSERNFTGWVYVLQQQSWDIYASGMVADCWDDFRNSCDKNATKIALTWSYNYLSWNTIHTWDIQDLLWWWWDFYRVVKVFWIYNKIDSCNNSNCPKEMRFCVKVFYDINGKHSSELCSIMTNFEK